MDTAAPPPGHTDRHARGSSLPCAYAASRRAAGGYLLIEVLIALLLAAGLLPALVALQLGLYRDGRLAAERSIAAAHAEHGLESLFGRLRAGEDIPPATGLTDPEELPPRYWRSRSVAPMQQVTALEVVVAWPEPDTGPPRRVALPARAQPAAAADSGRAATRGRPVISP